jgi:uncharacterized membrane protein YccC
VADGERGTAWREGLGNGAGCALVAVFCFATASRVSFLHEPYWAPIGAVVVLQSDREATRKAGLDRFVGTAIGCLIGWAAAWGWHGQLAVYGVAVLVAVTVCYLLRLPTAARLCAVAVTVITLVPHAESPATVALFRFVEVSYGVACALAYTAAVAWLGARRSRTERAERDHRDGGGGRLGP